MSWAVLEELDFELIESGEAVAFGVSEHVGRVAARADVQVLTDDELLASVGAVERTRRYTDAAAAHLLAELDSRGVTDERRGLRTGQWVALETHGPIPTAQRRVSMSVRMRDDFPAIGQALTDCQIEWRHAQVLIGYCNPRIIEKYKDKLPWLIGLAQEMAFEPWKRKVAEVARRLDFDGGYQPDSDPEASKLFIDRLTGDDITLLRGMFVGADGTMLAEILGERADQIRRRLQHNQKTTNGAIAVPSRPALLAMALLELLREARAADPTKAKNPTTDLTVVLHWNISDLYPNGLTPDAGTTNGGATLDSLLASGRYDTRRLNDLYETFDQCRHCGTSMQDRLCDPAIQFLVTDADGCPLNLGRTERFASPDQRKAAKIRDGGCTFPGCDCAVNWCDLHHVDPYNEGGDTDIDKLACLCRFHHGVTHRKGWTMTATGDGWFTWTTPNGDTLHSQRNQQQRAGP